MAMRRKYTRVTAVKNRVAAVQKKRFKKTQEDDLEDALESLNDARRNINDARRSIRRAIRELD